LAVEISDQDFQDLINEAMATLPQEHVQRLENVAILYEYDTTPEQRLKLRIRNDQTLFGLYEGVPLSQRQGVTRLFPDKITIFKNPICANVNSLAGLKEQIRHTLWHEIAHYYGLDHGRIHELEEK
jgi:predicted Zn-dependent protease with MMP-like domain